MCPRPKKHKLQSTPESLNNLLQEIYNECAFQRAEAIHHRNKILKEIEELEDIGMVGKITVDLLKIVDSAIDKKLALAKIQAGLLNGGKSNTENESELSPEQMKFLRETMKKIKKSETVEIPGDE
jgi:hypothetical protein